MQATRVYTTEYYDQCVLNLITLVSFCRRVAAANGAIMRTAILGVLNFNGELGLGLWRREGEVTCVYLLCAVL